MWLDAFTSVVPLFLIFYVLIQHYSGYIEPSHFQAKTASVTAYTMLLDFGVDLGVGQPSNRRPPIRLSFSAITSIAGRTARA